MTKWTWRIMPKTKQHSDLKGLLRSLLEKLLDYFLFELRSYLEISYLDYAYMFGLRCSLFFEVTQWQWIVTNFLPRTKHTQTLLPIAQDFYKTITLSEPVTSSSACISWTIFLPAAVESSWFNEPICFAISINHACRFSASKQQPTTNTVL